MARWLGQLLVLAVVAGVALTALATPASAHGQLAMSTPAKDSTVTKPMESLALYFTEKPASNAYFTVTTPSGARVDEPWSHGQPERLDEPVTEYNLVDGKWQPNLYHTGFPATVPVAYWPEQGLYVARYVSVASDGEKVTGEVRFTYEGPMSKAPKGWKAPTNEPDPALLATVEPSTTASAGPAAPVTSQATPQAAASNAPQATSGFDLSVWLLPAVLVVGAGFMVVRAARRPSPRGAEVRRRSTGPPARRPPGRSATASRKPRSAKAVKTAKRR
ncbi:copper resistance protein CopC [Streptosporangium sp. NBC_01495]|uniref:copper resistance CopC family protein n=1 Tax=Streptosporangium sp. NBC_01495 TaxID=2903899 RepID=UPI002E309700|nr:copper resistance protein CopC [Streptosporangium sp. NBC_01495]